MHLKSDPYCCLTKRISYDTVDRFVEQCRDAANSQIKSAATFEMCHGMCVDIIMNCGEV